MPRWESFDAFLGEAMQTAPDSRQTLVDALLREHREWPWVQGDRATFIYVGMGTQNVAVNLDTIPTDPPFAPMEKLEGTSLWYITREFAPDDLLDYLLAVDDPMTPLAEETDIVSRISRHWRVDPLNPTRMSTSQMNVSVLRMEQARPFPDWTRMYRVKHGQVYEHSISSAYLRFNDRKLWVYTPPGYDENPERAYPLLIFQDGQWAVGPLQLTYIADALIKHGRMEPVIIATPQSGDQKERLKTFISSDRHYNYTMKELMPFIQSTYRVDSAQVGIGGVAVGAIAAAHAALNNPSVFTRLAMISPPLGKGIAQEQLLAYAGRFERAEMLPQRIWQSVGRYETRSRFYLPAQVLNRILRRRVSELSLDYQYIEVGSGHGLVGFRSVLPEALAWIFPGPSA